MGESIAIIYVSHGIKDTTTYDSLNIDYRERESESDERTNIYENYCCGLKVEVHCVYRSKQYEFIECERGVTAYFLTDSNLNPVLSKIETEYICIVDQGVEVTSDLWLTNLLFNYTHINKSGVIGISNNTLLSIPTFLSNNDEKESIVFMPRDGIVNGLTFFSKLLYYHVGVFGSNLRGWEMPHFCIRSINHGYFNYYIDGEICLGMYAKADGIGRINMQNSLFDMKKNRNWYLSE